MPRKAIGERAMTAAERQRRRRERLRPKPAPEPAKPPKAAASDDAARAEIDRLRKRLDEIDPYLADMEFWMIAAERIVKSRKGIMTHAAWANLIRCLHPDTRKNESDKHLDTAFRLVEQRKLALCDELQMPTQKRSKAPAIDWEARLRFVSERRKAKQSNRKIKPT
jgi:hypothetical protein